MTCDLVTNYNDKKKRQTTYYLCNKLAMNTYNVFEKGSIDSNNFIFGAEDLSVYNNYPIIFKNYFKINLGTNFSRIFEINNFDKIIKFFSEHSNNLDYKIIVDWFLTMNFEEI